MRSVLILELLARGAAVGAFLGVAIAIVRQPITPARITGALFCLSAAGHALIQHGAIRLALGTAWLLAWVFSVMGAGFFWAFVTELFEDRPRLQATRFAPAALLLAIGVIALLSPREVARGLWLSHNFVGAGFLIHALVVIGKGWRGDLVEPRRRLRGPILGAAALYAIVVLVVQSAEILWRPADALSPVAAVALLALGLAGIGALLQAEPDLFAPAGAPRTPITAAAPAMSDEAARTAERLHRLMRDDRLYRDERLTIAALAARLGMPEYRLRRLINQQLGYRNFSSYLNSWRLTEAKAALGDAAQREVPVSTIALDAGYQSLGPFNRAFKAETGVTPTEFRARALAARSTAKPDATEAIA
jgi:AraC-like DNA-binding protein